MPLIPNNPVKGLLNKAVDTVSGLLPSSLSNSPATVQGAEQEVELNTFLANRHNKSAIRELLKGDPFGFAIDLFNSKKLLKHYYINEPNLDYQDSRFKNQGEIQGLLKDIENTFDKNLDKLMENLQDPLILGYDVFFGEQSPLFGYRGEFNDSKDESDQRLGGQEGIEEEFRTPISLNDDPLRAFIEKYADAYPEIGLTDSHVISFRQQVKKLFNKSDHPRSGQRDDNNQATKFHYVNELGNLKVLDDLFQQPLTFENNKVNAGKSYIEVKLQEDATLYANNLAFLYRNINYSYKLGKRLIPENLLRFNMYIKFTEIRNYTSMIDAYLKNKNGQADVTKTTEEYVNILRSKATCVIYEIKDCYFIFDETTLPNSITQAGFGQTNSKFADLSFKIGFREVERYIFPLLRYLSNGFGRAQVSEQIIKDGYSIWDGNIGYDEKLKKTDVSINDYKLDHIKDVLFEQKKEAYKQHNEADGYLSLKDNVIRTPEVIKKPNAIDNFIDKKLGGITIAGVNLGNEAKILSSEVKKAGKDIAREGIKQIKGAVYGVRNELVNTLENKISGITGFGLPRPANIYGYRYQRDAEGDIKLDDKGNPIAEKIKDNSIRGIAEKAVDAIVNGINSGDDPAKHHPGPESYNIYEDRQSSPNYQSNKTKNATVTNDHSVFQATTKNGDIVPRLNPEDYAKSIGENSDRHITPNYRRGVLNTNSHDLFTDDKFAPRQEPNDDRHQTPNYTNGVINAGSHNLYTDEKFNQRTIPNDDRHITPNYTDGIIASPSTHNLYTDENFNPRPAPTGDRHITPNYTGGVLNASGHDLYTDEKFNKRSVPNDDRHLTPNYDRGVLNTDSHNLYTNEKFEPRDIPNDDRHITNNYVKGVLNTDSHNLYTDEKFNPRSVPQDDRHQTPNYTNGVINSSDHNLYTDEKFNQRTVPNDDRHPTPNYTGGKLNQSQDLYTDEKFNPRETPTGDRHITPNYNNGVVNPLQSLYTDEKFNQRGAPEDNRHAGSKPESNLTEQNIYTTSKTDTPNTVSGNVYDGSKLNQSSPEDLGNINNGRTNNQQNTDLNNIYD